MSGAGRSHRGPGAGGPRLVRRRQPAARAAAAGWSTTSRASPDVARLAVVVDVRGGRMFDDLARALDDVAGRGHRPAGAVPRGRRRRARPPLREQPAPAPAAGRRRGSSTASPREREHARRPARAAPTSSSTPRALNVHDLRRKVDAAFGGERPRAAARHGDVVRLQVRPAARRRHRHRRPVPAQPVLGARAARARPASTPTVSDYVPSCPEAPRVPRPLWPRCSTSWPTATCARASATSPSPSAAPAASTAASRWPRTSPRGW